MRSAEPPPPRASAGEPLHESSLPWTPGRPAALIICCVDGRWFPHVVQFARERLGAGELTDFMAVPGGAEPLTLFDLIPKDFNFFKRRIESLVEAHGTRRIIAIAHQDCAWYKARKIGPLRLELKDRQLADLRRAARGLRELLPEVRVETYFARLDGEPARVVFEAVG